MQAHSLPLLASFSWLEIVDTERCLRQLSFSISISFSFVNLFHGCKCYLLTLPSLCIFFILKMCKASVVVFKRG